MPYTFPYGTPGNAGEHMKKSIKRICKGAEKVEMAVAYILIVGGVYATALAYMYSAARENRRH